MTDGRGRQRKPDFRTAVADAKALATVLAMEAESVLGRRTARFLGSLALFALVVGVLLALLDWYIAPSGADQKKDLVVTLAQILAGTALLSGLYFTWRTLQVNREGQITERFTRAIDQLGSNELEIRLGGIYALERIARDSEQDHWPIMEVLTAYVRQHAPARPEEDQLIAVIERRRPAPDIQAIMAVLRRRTRFWGHGEPERLDLGETHLSGADFTEANLSRANLRKTNLGRAILWGANLSEAYLSEAYLEHAILHDTNLMGATLSSANLTGADLHDANLSGAAVTPEKLEQTYGNKDTRLPSDLKPPAQWGVKTDEQTEGS